MKKGLLFSALLASLLLVGCASDKGGDEGGNGTNSNETVVTETVLTPESLNIVDKKYGDGTAEINGVTFEFKQLCEDSRYTDGGIQMRTKDGVSSSFYNTTAFTTGVKELKIVMPEKKVGFSNAGALKISLGDTAEVSEKEILFDTVKDQTDHIITFDKAYKFVKVTHNFDHTFYASSFTFVPATK